MAMKLTEEQKKQLEERIRLRRRKQREEFLGKAGKAKEEVDKLKFIRKNKKKFTDKQLTDMFKKLRD